MNAFKNQIGNEQGSVIAIILFVLVLITVIGISATNMSTTEQTIAGNDKNHKIAFYHVESGPYALAKLVKRTNSDDNLAKDINGVGHLDGADDTHQLDYLSGDSGETYSELRNFNHGDNRTPDFEYSMTTGVKGSDGVVRTVTSTVNAYVNKSKQRFDQGGGAEFGTGVRGVGEQAAIEIPYWFTAYTASAGGARAAVSAEYVYKLGMPGGL